MKQLSLKATHTITMVYRLVSEDRDRNSNMINPPPSTVSIVLARRFGVKTSKSFKQPNKGLDDQNTVI